jgi:hypothetical protein
VPQRRPSSRAEHTTRDDEPAQIDAKGLEVEESQLVLAAVAAMRKPAGVVSAAPALERLAATHGLLDVSRALRRLPR